MLPATKLELYAPVLALIAEGKTVTNACSECDVDQSTFWRARKGDPDLQAAYTLAQELGSEALADSLQDIGAEFVNPLMARVVSENRRWLLSRRFRERYGDQPANSDQRAELTDILREAIARIPRPASDQPQTIEAETVTVADIFGHDADD